MLIGDNLSNFSNVFEGNSVKERNDFLATLKNKFGREFIILPNPMYGDWERHGVFEGQYDWSTKQRDSILLSKLIIY
tara:strand:- start:139 stop:369 length:231 start_codon:yes stop_codon:yes gene_type:complete